MRSSEKTAPAKPIDLNAEAGAMTVTAEEGKAALCDAVILQQCRPVIRRWQTAKIEYPRA
jgi:hypothetical protein